MVLLAVAAGATGCAGSAAPTGGGSSQATSPTRTTVRTEPVPPPDRPRHLPRRSALAALSKLPVKGRAPKTGYSRDQFGEDWATFGGCDTRDLILARDLSHKTVAGDGCEVLRGQLNDPYTGASIEYVRGGASEVDIDHVVALGDAWQKGAQQWSPVRRIAFANDPLNLLAVDSSANREKGDGDAATWLPPNKAFRCAYVARQIAVKRKYGAWVTRAERDAMSRVLARCPRQRLPRAGRRVVVTPAGPAPSGGTGSARVFANCDAVRAAGLAPLRRGTPEYSANRHLDRDGDGLACE